MISITDYAATAEEPGSFDIYCRFLVGNSGAITSFSRVSQHITSANVTRISAGLYKIPFTHTWYSGYPLAGVTPPSPLMDHSVKVIGAYDGSSGQIGFLTQDNTTKQSNRTIAHHSSDAVVNSTKTWTLGNGAFTQGDVGATIVVTGSATSNGTYTISSVTNATTIVTTVGPGADETLASVTSVALTDVAYVMVEYTANGGSAADVHSGNEANIVLQVKAHS